MSNYENIVVKLGAARAESILGGMADKLKDKGKFRVVVARVQNRVIMSMRSDVVKDIRNEYNVPAGQVRSTMTVLKADKDHLVASLTLKGKMSVELVNFSARATKKGVSVRVLKASKAGVIKAGGEKQVILETKKNKASATFIAKGHVLARIEGHDHPVMLWGPSFIAVLGREAIKQSLQQKAEARFTTRLQHEAAFALNGK